jgi:hypothetical protein
MTYSFLNSKNRMQLFLLGSGYRATLFHLAPLDASMILDCCCDSPRSQACQAVQLSQNCWQPGGAY